MTFEMEVIEIEPNTPEWLKYRMNELCASEAPAMMNESKFMSRNQLLAAKKGWKSNPVSEFTQRMYDKGHLHEDMARPIKELELFDELPPVIGRREVVSGLILSASFDGLTFSVMPWEHKDWNVVLAENVRNGVLEPTYYWQLEHQAIVADSDCVMFTVSDGTTENAETMIYQSIPERRERLIKGWGQFVSDLETYTLEPREEKAVAVKQDSMPELSCEVSGTEVVHNLPLYIDKIKELKIFHESIILETDQDFENKKAFNKSVKKTRALLKSAGSEVEERFSSLASFNKDVAEADSILQKMQSFGEKQVKTATENKKNEMIDFAIRQNDGFISAAVTFIPASEIKDNISLDALRPLVDFAGEIRGLSSMASIKNKLDSKLAELQIDLDSAADDIATNIRLTNDICKNHKFLFADIEGLILEKSEKLRGIVSSRIEEHDKRVAIEAERKQAEAIKPKPLPEVEAADEPTPKEAGAVHAGEMDAPPKPLKLTAVINGIDARNDLACLFGDEELHQLLIDDNGERHDIKITVERVPKA